VEASKRFFWSDGEERTPEDLGSVGTVMVLEADLYGESEPGVMAKERVGSMHGVLVRGHRDMALCTVTFEFRGEGSIVATGVLGLQEPSVGGGALTITGGTAEHRDRTGRVHLEEVTNPKRWSVESP
jgi:hypothetical protein